MPNVRIALLTAGLLAGPTLAWTPPAEAASTWCCGLGALEHPACCTRRASTPKVKYIRVRESSSNLENPGPAVLVAIDAEGPDVDVSVVMGGLPAPPATQTILARHGQAAEGKPALATSAAELSLVDADGKPLATFAGSVDAQGRLSLFPVKSNVFDIAVLSAETQPLTVDLAGADVGLVAAGKLAVKGQVPWSAALKWGAVYRITEFPLPAGVGPGPWQVTAKVAGPGSASEKSTFVDVAAAQVAAPWADGAEGVASLAAIAAPKTSVAFVTPNGKELADILENERAFVVVSDGHLPGADLPSHAQLALEGGPTLQIPANSYQITGSAEIEFQGDPTGHVYTVQADTGLARVVAGDRHGHCHLGRCFCLAGTLGPEGKPRWNLAVTAYGPSAAKLPPMVVVAFPSAASSGWKDVPDPGPAPTVTKIAIPLDPEVAVVFAHTVALAGDPFGTEQAGTLALFGASGDSPLAKLAVGHFTGRFSRGLDGVLALAAIGKGPTQGRGDILIGGEPIGIEKTDPKGNVMLGIPPAVVLKASSNGKGTRNVATTNNGKPALL